MIGNTHAICGKIETEALSVVCVQFPPERCLDLKGVLKNITSITDWMERAVNTFPGVDLIVFSECSAQGGGPFCSGVLLDLQGPEVQQLKDSCRRLDVFAVFDIITANTEGHAACNTAIIVNNQGELIHQYVKMNPWIPEEPFYPGHFGCTAVAGPKGSRLATIICADGDYPEMWRLAARSGANVIVRISHYPVPWENAWEITNKAGAYCNQIYVVACNTVGYDDTSVNFGSSMILNPDGRIITQAPMGLPWMIKADIYPGLVDKMRRDSVSNNFLWAYEHRGASHPEVVGVGLGLAEYQVPVADES